MDPFDLDSMISVSEDDYEDYLIEAIAEISEEVGPDIYKILNEIRNRIYWSPELFTEDTYLPIWRFKNFLNGDYSYFIELIYLYRDEINVDLDQLAELMWQTNDGIRDVYEQKDWIMLNRMITNKLNDNEFLEKFIKTFKIPRFIYNRIIKYWPYLATIPAKIF